MKLLAVDTPKLVRAFLNFNAIANAQNPNYIRPLDNEVEAVFDPKKNKLFNFFFDGVGIIWHP